MFFQIDDQLHLNRKVTSMIDEEGPAKAGPAMMLWTLAGSLCRSSFVDGVVTAGNAARLLADRNAAKRAAGLLVKYGLWHAPGHDCPVCPEVDEGTWLFHQWFQFNYGTGEAERTAIAKRKELRTPGIVEAVWARDTAEDGPRCRYCSKKAKRPEKGKGGNRRGADVGHLDHVDPTQAIGAANIVVACAECNQTKGQRTPEQAGMTLQPPPGSTTGSIGDQYGINTDTVPPAGARVGAGLARVGRGSGLGSGLGSADGPAGAAPTVPVPAEHGSPWRGHHGAPPPDDLIDAATCSTHGLPEPCRRCSADTYRPGGSR